ncbi:MAG TPA: sugar phosphate nucleotidyltransferase [Candidatus Limnocylindria bacterium]|nr:sugar phosphate nucleotidyltransferase [Candidatus Limnocylindria bacterium]
MALIGILPCAGAGTRLGVPFAKELMPLPSSDGVIHVCDLSIRSMLQAGITRLVVVASHKKIEIVRYIESKYGRETRCETAFQSHFPSTGSSPGLFQAIAEGCRLAGPNDTLLLALPDVVIAPTDVLAELVGKLDATVDAVAGVFSVLDCRELAPVLTDQEGRITQVLDKPDTSPVSNTWGCLAWNSRTTQDILTQREANPDLAIGAWLNGALSRGVKMRAVEFPQATFHDLGTPARWTNYLRQSLL